MRDIREQPSMESSVANFIARCWRVEFGLLSPRNRMRADSPLAIIPLPVRRIKARQGGIAFVASLVALMFSAIVSPISAQIIQTVAGGGIGDGGPATAAPLYEPGAVAVDSSGNLYFVDGARVRKVSSANGVVTTAAGTGTYGHSGDNALATSATFGGADALAIDPSGNLYIADANNSRIRKVTASTGIITTVAGTGTYGYNGDNIAATSAMVALYNRPSNIVGPGGRTALAVDSSGNLYILDPGNARVRKVTVATGVITTVFGSGSPQYGDSSALYMPRGIALDKSGNLYILDDQGLSVSKVAADTGTATKVAGAGYGFNGDNIPAAGATLKDAGDIAVDSSGNLYIADTENNRIRKVTVETGVITSVAGPASFGYDGITNVTLLRPRSVSVDSSGNVYFADAVNSFIVKVASTNGVLSKVVGTGTPGYNGDNIAAVNASLYAPSGIATDSSGNLYIADTGAGRIRKVTAGTGLIATLAGTSAAGAGNGDNIPATSSRVYPKGIAVHSSGDLYLTDSYYRVRKVTTANMLITTVAGVQSFGYGSAGYNGDGIPAAKAMLASPEGTAVDAAGNLYIADTDNNRIRKVSADNGIISTVAGNGGFGFGGDGIGVSVYRPKGVTFDSSGNMYIADAGNHRIRKMTAGGVISTLAGNGTAAYSGDGSAATGAALNSPGGVAVDAAGNLFIADTLNHRVRKVTASTGVISTVAGTGLSGYNGDNIAATSATLYQPSGVAVDSLGNLYVSDTWNHRVRKVAGVASAAPIANYQGLWWNAPAGSESGWGINFAHQGNIIFATWFTYDNAGKALWLTMTAGKIGTSYRGTLFQTRGPAFSAAPFNPNSVIPTAVGGGELTFSDENNGQFSYTIAGTTQTKAITRQVFGPLPTCTYGAQPDLTRATNYQDLWWVSGGAESGWGVNFTHQGDTIFGTWFTYDTDGAPLWLSATATKTGANAYTGTLYRTTGPAFSAVPFLPASVGLTSVGSLALTFANGNSATFAYTVNGVTQSKSITRQVFNAPGTVCQ